MFYRKLNIPSQLGERLKGVFPFHSYNQLEASWNMKRILNCSHSIIVRDFANS